MARSKNIFTDAGWQIIKRAVIIILFTGFLLPSIAQVDRSRPPEPGPAPQIQIGDYTTFTLDNGMRVIVVENDKIPVVSFQLTLDIDPVMEGEAAGYVGMAGSLMRTGTTTRNKAEIDEEIDFIGATLSTYSSGIFASSLTRHTGTLLELMSDVLLNPVFPQEELDRQINQTLTGLSAVLTDASAMVGNVSTRLVYGEVHPYGEVTTPETVENITRELLVDYHNTYFRPNAAYMIIVGDIRTEQAKELMERYFSAWQPGEVPTHNYEIPLPPPGNTVAIAERAGAVQSVISVTYPVYLKPGDPDAISASVMNGILGGGAFSGRLMQNLREDKGFTYGARSSLSSDRLVGRFTARTEVRNSVTDSAIVEILREMERMVSEPVDEETLELTRNFLNGSFARSLESPRTIASFALNIERYNLPEDYYDTYLERLSQVTAADVQRVAGRFLRPENSFIVVGGDKSEVAGSLEKFSSDGSVLLFDPFGRRIVEDSDPEAAAKPEAKTGFEPFEEPTAEKVIDRYIRATGGAYNLGNIKEKVMFMQGRVQGNDMKIIIRQKYPDKYKMTLQRVIRGQDYIIMEQVLNGNRGMHASPSGFIPLEEQVIKELKQEAIIVPELSYGERGFSLTLEGTETINGEEAYKILITGGPLDQTRTEYFSIATGFKLRSETLSKTPSGNMMQVTSYSDYRRFGAMTFPFRITQQLGGESFEMQVYSLQINEGIPDDEFRLHPNVLQ
jgi:zinc protease